MFLWFNTCSIIVEQRRKGPDIERPISGSYVRIYLVIENRTGEEMKPKMPHITPIVVMVIGLLLVLIVSFTSLTKIDFTIARNFIYTSTASQKLTTQNPKGKKEIFLHKLVEAAIKRTHHKVIYDPGYVKIKYPGGDVPDNRGVCTDVIIRSYRKLGIDLQKEIHEDMSANLFLYPKIWKLTKPDPNIDHRRVPNMMTFFKRKGEVLPITNNPDDYSPGDILAWDLRRGVTHIGIVIDKRSADKERFMIVHNIGSGPRIEDVLFDWKIIGHFRYFGNTGNFAQHFLNSINPFFGIRFQI